MEWQDPRQFDKVNRQSGGPFAVLLFKEEIE